MKKIIPLLIALALAISMASCNFEIDLSLDEGHNGPLSSGELRVHFIDVGQADSILVQDGLSTMLIDAGNNGDTELVVDYIKKQGITKIDYLIGTHPHEDHIGGLDGVIDAFDIGTVYMPRKSHTTKTFKDVVKAMSTKGLKVTTPRPGDSFRLSDSVCTILAPNSETYDSLNDYSVVIKLMHGGVSFLFTGDAEAVSESEMLQKGFDLSATVLKLGHHGSSSSTTDEFLQKVNPRYGVISVGEGNDYGHPHVETMNKLKDRKIELYRTDQNGTIIAVSDKNSVTWNSQPGNYHSGSN